MRKNKERTDGAEAQVNDMENVEEIKNFVEANGGLADINKRLILQIFAKDSVNNTEEGLELNNGYEFNVDSTLPEVADGLSKMAIELDKDKSLGENAGSYFLKLVLDFYNKNKQGD